MAVALPGFAKAQMSGKLVIPGWHGTSGRTANRTCSRSRAPAHDVASRFLPVPIVLEFSSSTRPFASSLDVLPWDLTDSYSELHLMVAPMDSDQPGKLDAARALQAQLEAARLNIVEDRSRFDSLQSALAKDPGLISEGVAGTTDPAIVAAEVASQIVRSTKS